MDENEQATVDSLPALLRARDAARILAVSPRKLWELTNTGEIPSVRIGRAVRYDVRDLNAWIDEQRRRQNRRNRRATVPS